MRLGDSMLHPRLARFALLGIAFLLVVPSIPAANTPIEGTLTKSYPEDYESFATVPTAPTTPWATFNTAGAGTAQVTATTLTGSTRALSVTDDAVAGFVHQQLNTGSGVNLCVQDQTLSFTFTLTSSLTTGQSVELRASTAASVAGTQPADSFGLILTGQLGAGELASVYMRGDTGGAVTPTSIGTFTLPAVGSVLMDTIICAGSTPQVRFVISGGGLSFTGTYTAAVAFVGTVNRFNVAHISSAAPFGGTVDVDDFLWSGAPLPAPTVTAINPTQGTSAGGTPVTITGTGFKNAGGLTATIGGSAVTGLTWVSATTLTGNTGAHSAGSGFAVVVTNPDGQSGTLTSAYQYNPSPQPIITSFTPTSGIKQGGTLVNITGQNFQSGAEVSFGGFAANSVTFVSSVKLSATSPPHDPGAVFIQVTNPDGGAATSTTQYTYVDSQPPPATTELYREYFDNDNANTCPTESWYTYTGSNIPGDNTCTVPTSNGVIVSTPRETAPFAFRANNAGWHVAQGGTVTVCNVLNFHAQIYVSGTGSGNLIGWHSDTIQGGSGRAVLGLSPFYAGGPTFTMSGFLRTAAQGTATTVGATMTAPINTWTPISVTATCSGTTLTSALFTMGVQSQSVNGVSYPTTLFNERFGVVCSETVVAGCGLNIYTDDIQLGVGLGTAPAANAKCIFCSAEGNDNFGFEYAEGVDLIDNGRYRFQGNTEDFSYLGKSWTGGTKVVSSYFAIQAATDSQSSVFRSNFGTLGTTPSGSTKGNGKSTGHFAEHIEVQFQEVSDDWNVRIYHVSASNGVSSRTQLGTAVIEGDPNAFEFYNFTVNTITGKAYVTKTELFGDNPGQKTALFPNGVTLPAYWSNDQLLDHWFVGYGAEAATNCSGATHPFCNRHTASTRLSSGADWKLSTCIYSFDNLLSAANGDQGRTPPTDDGSTIEELTGTKVGVTGNSTVGDEMFGEPPGSFFLPANAVLPDGFTRSSFSFLLGVLFMFAVAGGAYFVLGRSPMAAGIGGAGGFMGAFAFGLFPLWAVLLVALGCAAVFVLRFRANGG